jgi:hypothetical protein
MNTGKISLDQRLSLVLPWQPLLNRLLLELGNETVYKAQDLHFPNVNKELP